MYYRKLPNIVQAIMWDGTNLRELIDKLPGFKDYYTYVEDYGFLYISTLRGVVEAKIGDFIVRGERGEFYPCKNDNFLKTYEKISEEEAKQCLKTGNIV